MKTLLDKTLSYGAVISLIFCLLAGMQPMVAWADTADGRTSDSLSGRSGQFVTDTGQVSQAEMAALQAGSDVQNPVDYLKGAKEKALVWLQKQLEEEPGTDLPNETLEILQLLREEGQEQDTSTVFGWNKLQQGRNTDQDARYAAALQDRTRMQDIMGRQNQDGGFGLTCGYQSDILDSMLVLQGLQRCGMEQGAGKLLSYFEAAQNGDGGYSYTELSASDPWLTARAGYEIFLCTKEEETGQQSTEESQLLQEIDTYILTEKWDNMSETEFLESAWGSVYSYERGLDHSTVIAVEELLKRQQADGSFYGDIEDTAAAVRLMNAMCHYLASVHLDSMETECSTHLLETERETPIRVTVKMKLSVVTSQELKLVVQAEDEGKVVGSQSISFHVDSSRQDYQETASLSFPDPEYRPGYTVHVLLYAGEKCIGETTDIMKVRKKEDGQIRLQAKVVDGEDYSVHLDWNDISHEETQYGYRIYRQREKQEWETRSAWDGKEKVKVLNIYPCYAAKNYLRDWMEKTIDQSEDSAGKGLFTIDTVFIEDYNKEPDRYLLDAKGRFQYDVLMFGTYDANAYQDLTQLSYEATSRFIQSGRGVLFGHDTVVHCYPVWNTWFPKFAPEIGAVLQSSCVERVSSRVKVVNGGFLTSYPWKLSGTLNIPPAHSLGQCAGGSLGSTVWMAMDVNYQTDLKTGAMDAPYLFSKNQTAMIQTGHSNGQATDDERKIIANTLFYLKQLTEAKQAEDKSFYDEAAPSIDSAEWKQDFIQIAARDQGTNYRYYVEGVPQGSSSDQETKKSNIVEANALSGIQGYIMSMDRNSSEDQSLAERAEDGSLKAEILTLQQEEEGGITAASRQEGILALPDGEREPGTWYIHLRAVDYAGNVSEEATLSYQQKKKPGEPWFQTGYHLFSMEQDLNLNCCEADIEGKIYSGRDFNFGGSILSVTGACETVGNANIYGWKLDVPEKRNTNALHLPDYREDIWRDLEHNTSVQELNCYNSTEIQEPILCSRTSGAWCPDLKIHAGLACQGDISLNTNTLAVGAKRPVTVMSRQGNITVNCTDFQFHGLLYAPEGTVSINVSTCKLAGTIIAKEIKIQGSYYYGSQSPD